MEETTEKVCATCVQVTDCMEARDHKTRLLVHRCNSWFTAEPPELEARFILQQTFGPRALEGLIVEREAQQKRRR